MDDDTNRVARGGGSQRERALEAALTVLGEEGPRALTHSRVDAVAGLPRGSASNYFRTRRALVEGVVQHLAAVEQGDFGDVASMLSPDGALAAFVAMLEAQTGPFRHRTLARYALFVDAAHEEELLSPLLSNRRDFEQWTTAILAGLGAARPAESATFLMATLDGLLLHRLTVDPQVPFGPHVSRALEACLRE